MSDQLDPTLGPIPGSPVAYADPGAGTWTVEAQLDRGQTAQRGTTSLDTMLADLPEPALLHRDGRLVAINPPLESLLDHPAVELLIGLPVDALIESVGTERHGRAHAAQLTTRHGPVPVSLSVMDMDLRDDRGTIWIFGPPPALGAEATERARVAVEQVCDTLWDGELPDRAALLDALTGVLDLLNPTSADEPALHAPDLAVAVRRAARGRYVEIRSTGTVDTSPDALHHLLTGLLSSCADDASARVEVDLSGRPTLVLRREVGTVLPASVCQDADILVSAMRGSLVQLDGGRVVRLRLPAGR